MLDVLFVNHLPLGSASSYRQAGFAKYLRRLGHNVSFLGRVGKVAKPKAEEMKEWDQFQEIYHWEEPLVQRFPANTRLLQKTAKERSVVHVNRANPYTATLISAVRPSLRCLTVDVEDWDGFGGYASYARKYNAAGGLLTLYEDIFPRTADSVIVVSELLRRRMLHSGIDARRILLIPNGFDPDIFHPGILGDRVRESYGLGSSPVVIYASTFWEFERRQHEIALGAFKRMAEQVPEVKFLLVGSGNVAMSKLVGQFGLEKNAVATGFVPREEVPQLMSCADVAMHVISEHTFHAASSPMIIPEYMAVGKPIVAPAVGELASMLAGGAGYLVDQVDSELLAGGVVKLLKDEPLRNEYSRRAALKAPAYSYGILAKKLVDAYERANG